MRKPLLLFVLIACSLAGHSQIDKGKWVTGVNLQFDLQNSKGQDDFTNGTVTSTGKGEVIFFNVNGEVFYQIKNNAAIGIGIGVANRVTTVYDGAGGLLRKNKISSQNLYAIYQLQKKISNKFSYNPRIEARYSNQTEKEISFPTGYNSLTGTVKSNIYGVNLKPLNIRFFISDKFFIESTFLTLAYNYYSYKDYPSDRISKRTTSEIEVTASMIFNNISLFYKFN